MLSVSFSSNDAVGHSLRPRQPRGARHRGPDGSRHRRTAGARRHARRPRPHPRRADGRSRRRARCPKSSSSGTCPAAATTATTCYADRGGADREVRAGQLDRRDGRHVAVPELRADRARRISTPSRCGRWRRPPRPRRRTSRGSTRATRSWRARCRHDTIGRRIARSEHLTRQAISRSSWIRTGCAPRAGRRTARRTPTTRTFRWCSWDPASSPGHYDANVALNDLAPTRGDDASPWRRRAGSQGRVLSRCCPPRSGRPADHVSATR